MTNGAGNLVTIRDIDVPFWRIVMILVKWSIASIPAMIVLMTGAAAREDRMRAIALGGGPIPHGLLDDDLGDLGQADRLRPGP